jgi:hypothetical protein
MSGNDQRQHTQETSVPVAIRPHATVREIVSTVSAERLSVLYHCLTMRSAGSYPRKDTAVADVERTKIAAKNKFSEELGVLVTFLDPRLKARREAKITDPSEPWSARKALFFFLFVTSASWAVVLAVLYLLYIIIF